MFNVIVLIIKFVKSYFDCVSELGVVNRVHTLLLCYYGNKAVAPLDLLRDVGGAGLRGDACSFHDSLQDDNHLQVAALQLNGGQVIQWAVKDNNILMFNEKIN